MKQVIRPAIFKWRQTKPELILCAVRWHLRYSLSFRDVEELLRERGLEADQTTNWRWVQRSGPELEERLRSGPRNLDSGLSEIFIVFQAAVPKLVASKYTTSGVRRPSAL